MGVGVNVWVAVGDEGVALGGEWVRVNVGRVGVVVAVGDTTGVQLLLFRLVGERESLWLCEPCEGVPEDWLPVHVKILNVWVKLTVGVMEGE